MAAAAAEMMWSEAELEQYRVLGVGRLNPPPSKREGRSSRASSWMALEMEEKAALLEMLHRVQGFRRLLHPHGWQ